MLTSVAVIRSLVRAKPAYPADPYAADPYPATQAPYTGATYPNGRPKKPKGNKGKGIQRGLDYNATDYVEGDDDYNYEY